MTRYIATSALALSIGAGAGWAQDVTLTLWTESATAPEGIFAQGQFNARLRVIALFDGRVVAGILEAMLPLHLKANPPDFFRSANQSRKKQNATEDYPVNEPT